MLSTLWQRFRHLPILGRLLLGNSAVIIVGAIGGTLFTHYLGDLNIEADFWLIGLFSTLGILLSLIVNYWIVKTTLRPVRELREAVDQVQAKHGIRVSLTSDSDPDLVQLAVAINSMLDRMEKRSAQLRALSERAINAQEDERRRIARGLHDDTGQALSTLIIDLERLETALPADAPDLRQRLAETRQLAVRTLDDLRKVVYDLRPTMLDDLGLASAIRWYARAKLDEAAIRLKFEPLDETMRLTPELETALFRIAQEAINNIVRHAEAKSVTVRFGREDGYVCLEVEDNGCGFDVASVTGQALRLRRFGLLGIQERADLVGGEATLDSEPGRGTCLRVRLPLAEME